MTAIVAFIRRPSSALLPFVLTVAAGCGTDAEPSLATDPAPNLSSGAEVQSAPLAFRQVSAGASFTCGVTSDDLAYCWGSNFVGELGIGTLWGPPFCLGSSTCSVRPMAVTGGLKFRSVTLSDDYACGVTTDSQAYCWGAGNLGQLGDGTWEDRSVPVPVAGGLRFRQVSAESTHTCGVTTDNRVYCWGDHLWSRPTPLEGGLAFRQVSGESNHTCGLTTANQTYCWRANTLTPVRVSTTREFTKLDAGFDYTCAVTAIRQAFCWGANFQGQLGDGTTISRESPRAVTGGIAFDRVTAGFDHTCGEAPGNLAYCWGSGPLGDGTTSRRLKPVLVQGGHRFTQLTAGGHHTCGLTDAALVYCWGDNSLGQLGDGTRTVRLRPRAVVGP